MAQFAQIFSEGEVLGEAILIFLTVGSWHKGFDRLVRAVDELVENKFIDEVVIAQIGYTAYRPKRMKEMEFCSPNEFVKYISDARVVISHAGVGSIVQAIKCLKPIIVVPRRANMAEANDDHQFVTAKALEEEGKVLVAYSTVDIALKLKESDNFVPTINDGSNDIIRAVDEFINKLAEKVRR